MKERLLISDSNLWKKIHSLYKKSGGVYKLILANESGSPLTIGRFLKADIEGVLYIGKASNYLDRVIELKKSLSPEHISTNHECGVRFKRLLVDFYKYEHLWIDLIPTENMTEMENEQLLSYEKEFGEFPPLNRRI